MLALITVVFTWQQTIRQNELEDQRTRQAQKLEDQRAEAERDLAAQRAQDEALQAYLDQMNYLLLEKDLRASDTDSEVRTLARARTLTVLGRLDPSRKTAVMQFLVEAELVQKVVGEMEPIIGLSGADLSGADLSGANLTEANLSHVNLNSATLSNARLTKADLSHAKLVGTNLSDANLSSADLTEADLSKAYLSGAYEYPRKSMTHKRLVDTQKLEEQAASLEGVTMPDGSKHP
jgi:uncharacterized protein YjbI with pentapeptide repeats